MLKELFKATAAAAAATGIALSLNNKTVSAPAVAARAVNAAKPSYELGYAFKLCRMMLIVLIALFNLWGFIAGLLITTALIAFNSTVTGRCYLYPLIPFDWQKLSGLLIRKKLNDKNN